MKKWLISLALAIAAWTPLGAWASWVGLDDGDYIVTLQCTNSVSLDCSVPIVGAITISGDGMSAMDLLVGGQSFQGDPMDFLLSNPNGASAGSSLTGQPFSAVALRQVTEGEVLGFVAGQRYWAYCSPFSATSCLADTTGTWSAEPVGVVTEPPALATALLALLVLGATRRQRRAAGRRRAAAA